MDKICVEGYGIAQLKGRNDIEKGVFMSREKIANVFEPECDKWEKVIRSSKPPDITVGIEMLNGSIVTVAPVAPKTLVGLKGFDKKMRWISWDQHNIRYFYTHLNSRDLAEFLSERHDIRLNSIGLKRIGAITAKILGFDYGDADKLFNRKRVRRIREFELGLGFAHVGALYQYLLREKHVTRLPWESEIYDTVYDFRWEDYVRIYDPKAFWETMKLPDEGGDKLIVPAYIASKGEIPIGTEIKTGTIGKMEFEIPDPDNGYPACFCLCNFDKHIFRDHHVYRIEARWPLVDFPEFDPRKYADGKRCEEYYKLETFTPRPCGTFLTGKVVEEITIEERNKICGSY